jgi:hypothetical protein
MVDQQLVHTPWSPEPGVETSVTVPDVLRYRGGRSGVGAAEQEAVLDAAIDGLEPIAAEGALGTFSRTPESASGLLGVVTYPRDARPTRRHEVMHGYNEAAVRGVPGMPLSSRAVAALRGGQSPDTFRGGVAVALDELLAQGAGGTRMADVPWHVYMDQYNSSGAPWAAKTAAALNAAGHVQRHPARYVAMAAAAPLAQMGVNAASDKVWSYFADDEEGLRPDADTELRLALQRDRGESAALSLDDLIERLNQ